MELKNINVNINGKAILENINLKINDNDRIVVMGASGSGKTTLLNVISNRVAYKGNIEDKFSKIAYIFQEDRLIDELSVKENIELVLKNQVDLNSLASKLDLNKLLDSKVSTLSGGEKKRVNILRALAYDANVILADEPFSGLDINLRFKLLRHLKNEIGNKPLILVSHEIEDALFIATKIIIIKNGILYKEIENVDEAKRKEILDSLLEKENKNE